MDLNAGTLEIVVCVILISLSVAGNLLLIYYTKRCIGEHLRISFILIFNLAFDHIVRNLVVNVLKIVYVSGVGLDSASCKVLMFTTIFTMSLAIWFTLYIALLYCFKLYRVVHPPVEAASTNHRKCHMVLVFVLWVAGFAVCSPVLLYTEKTGNLTGENKTYQQHSILNYSECKTEYRNEQLEFLYGKIFLAAADLLPLIILLLVGFRIFHLLWEHKRATYGDIWIGDDTTETEVLRACKLVLALILLIASFWISHFILMYYWKHFNFYYFAPPVLTVLHSGYSAASPYLLMLINYKIKVKMGSCCCKGEKKTVSSTTTSSSVEVSPYA
ncbi:taste receptor type 2 member 3-like [Sphaerodactylus townsendi]|uniref:Uncharacterized protein n=1 Tax=Sphaerodactylus townsendi TaxID=933632 RepID=A0ACB8ERT8_9SAUR|nr:taste receptor type 2 member 3-like [Sphaerodactylus townsendi]